MFALNIHSENLGGGAVRGKLQIILCRRLKTIHLEHIGSSDRNIFTHLK